jgi:RNA ligase (TIGR02306 family)
MSNFKVIKTNIEIFDHHNADSLNIGKVGSFQVVVQKGLYKGGEEVIFAPEKSVLTGVLLEEYKTYLGGPEHNRVRSIRLRGELSCGIIIPHELVEKQSGKKLEDLPLNTDLKDVLGITQYVPEIPKEMLGKCQVTKDAYMSSNLDVEQFGVYSSEFKEEERVIATEKVHGSQVTVYIRFEKGLVKTLWLSTKNYNSIGLNIVEDYENFYWKAVDNTGLIDRVRREFSKIGDGVIQVFGEAIPAQKGYGYDHTSDSPSLRLFDIRKDTISVPLDDVPTSLKELWVPILYDGVYDPNTLRRLAKGREKVSGKEVHIREGIVVRPYVDRRASDGTRLYVKILNPKYKETGEEIN